MSSNQNTISDLEGVVKWFDPKKGFGFIVGPEGQDIFTHYTKIDGDGFRVLKDGSKVLYSAERGEKGWHATKVSRIDDVQGEGSESTKAGHVRTPRR